MMQEQAVRELTCAFYADYGDLFESLFEDRGLEFFGHLAHDVFAYGAVALAIALKTNIEGNVEEDRLHFVSEALGHLDPLAALVDGEIGRVHVVCGHAGDEPGTKERTQGGKDQALVALLLDIVTEDVAQQFAGERGDAAAAEPGGLSRAGQPDGKDDKSPGGLGRPLSGFRRGRNRHLRPSFEFEPA